MTLAQRLIEDQNKALKGGEKLRLSVLRMLRSELKNAQIAKCAELTEAEMLDVVSRYARKRKESATEYEKGGRRDLVEKELAELEIVQSYLPAALSEAELGALVQTVITELGAASLKQMGAVMKEVLQRTAGRADGAAVSSLVKSKLSG